MNNAHRLPEDMGARLQRLLQEKGYKASHVAQALNIPKASLSCWIGRGATTPRNPMVIKRLADFFGVSVVYLITGSSKETPTAEPPKEEPFYRFEVIVRRLEDKIGGTR